MSDLEALAQKTLYFAIGSASFAVEQAEKIFQEIGVQTQTFIEEMSERGQEIVEPISQSQGWNYTPQDRLWEQLLALVNGNKEVADRLVASAKNRDPGRSEEWYLEKVIYDLKRDRNY